jgi:hypothetical protein
MGESYDAAWLCPKVGWSVAGELRRCSATVQNYRWQQYGIKGHHIVDIRQADNPAFPDHLFQDRTNETGKKVFDKFNIETPGVTGCLQIPIRVVAFQSTSNVTFGRWLIDRSYRWIAPDLKLQDVVGRPLASILPGLMHGREAGFFD